jgi:hypothetical protein
MLGKSRAKVNFKCVVNNAQDGGYEGSRDTGFHYRMNSDNTVPRLMWPLRLWHAKR